MPSHCSNRNLAGFLFTVVGLYTALAVAHGAPGSPPAEGKSVTLYRPLEIKVRPEVYDPPLPLTDWRSTSAGAVPDWMEAIGKLRRPEDYKYQDWISGFTRDFILKRAINEQFHREFAEKRKNKRGAPGKASILWTAYITVENRELAYVSVFDGDHLGTSPKAEAVLPYAVEVICLERVDGVWRNQVYPVYSELRLFPFDSLPQMEKLCAMGAAVIDANNTLRPINLVKAGSK